MWSVIGVDHQLFIYEFSYSNQGYSLTLCDLVNVWFESLTVDEIIDRAASGDNVECVLEVSNGKQVNSLCFQLDQGLKSLDSTDHIKIVRNDSTQKKENEWNVKKDAHSGQGEIEDNSSCTSTSLPAPPPIQLTLTRTLPRVKSRLIWPFDLAYDQRRAHLVFSQLSIGLLGVIDALQARIARFETLLSQKDYHLRLMNEELGNAGAKYSPRKFKQAMSPSEKCKVDDAVQWKDGGPRSVVQRALDVSKDHWGFSLVTNEHARVKKDATRGNGPNFGDERGLSLNLSDLEGTQLLPPDSQLSQLSQWENLSVDSPKRHMQYNHSPLIQSQQSYLAETQPFDTPTRARTRTDMPSPLLLPEEPQGHEPLSVQDSAQFAPSQPAEKEEILSSEVLSSPSHSLESQSQKRKRELQEQLDAKKSRMRKRPRF